MPFKNSTNNLTKKRSYYAFKETIDNITVSIIAIVFLSFFIFIVANSIYSTNGRHEDDSYPLIFIFVLLVAFSIIFISSWKQLKQLKHLKRERIGTPLLSYEFCFTFLFYGVFITISIYIMSSPPSFSVYVLSYIAEFLIEIGAYMFIAIMAEKIVPQKKISVMLVSIKNESEYFDPPEDALFILKFMDEQGKFYFFPTDVIDDLEERMNYVLTVKGNKVLNIVQQWHYPLSRKVYSYWSGLYLQSSYGAEPVKIEIPLMLKVLWLLMLLFPALALFAGFVYLKNPSVVIALALFWDFLSKQKERGGK